MARLDPVTVEIIRDGLRSATRRMGNTLIRTAYSSVIYDGKDCSNAILDSAGRLLTVDTGVPQHIGCMPFGLRDVIEEYGEDVQPGDIFISNKPYHTIHLPDVLIASPVFYQGRFMFYSATRAHWTDVGGSTPGSLSGKATEIHQEGVIIPPTKLYDRGRLNKEALAIILANTRVPEERSGDIRAQISACKIGEQECVRLMDKYGPDSVVEACQEVIRASENYLRARIKELPKITTIYEDFLDNDGFDDTPLRIKVKVTIGEDHIEIDFTGTSPQCQGPYNCGYPLAWTAALLAIKIAFDPKGPTNEGVMKPIQIHVPEGSILNARYPAATGGATDVVVRAVEAILGALSAVMPEAVPGCDFGAINHTYISTVDRSSGRRHIYYSYPPGGNGGTCRMDGPGGLRGPQMGDVALQSMEMAEGLYPLLFRRFEFNPDSGGAGTFRGGMGLAIDVELLNDGMLSVVSERGKIPAYGLLGGDPGLAQNWLVSREGRSASLGVKIGSYPLKKGDIVQIRPGGGGGYGDPTERDPERVKQDIVNRLISVKHAEEAYGVVIRGEDLTVDLPKTGEKRRQLKKQRRLFTVASFGETAGGEVFRRVYLSASEKLFSASEMVELISFSRAAPLRAMAVLSQEAKPGTARLDHETMAILGISEGDSVWIRPLKTYGL
ncbi:MAG: hydantoinase B/oxoprolinase family protein [Pseudomonadota bacterium]